MSLMVLVGLSAFAALLITLVGGLLYMAKNPYDDHGRWDDRRDGEV